MSKFSRGKAKVPPSKSMSRKEKRKAERKLKKARRDAYAQRQFNLISSLKDVDTAFKAKQRLARQEKLKEKKKKTKDIKHEVKQKEEDTRAQGLRLAIQQDEKELKQLEKNLKFRKKKGKINLPTAFVNDGLDYILDATDSDKIKTFEDTISGYDHLEDSESDSNVELSGLDEESDSRDVQEWDPSAKAKKGILKVEKKQTKAKGNQKIVKFTEETEPEDVDMESDALSGLEDSSEEEIEKDGSEEEDANSEDDFNSKIESSSEKKLKRSVEESVLKEDIYGRLRDEHGNIVKPVLTGAYVPPAKRALMAGGHNNEQLHKKLKGLVNKVSEGTMQAISSQVESLYMEYSRADVNETMVALVTEALVTPVLSPERLVAEVAMLVAILHSNIGSEVGAFFIQKLAKKFDDLLCEPNYGAGKVMENVLLIIANIYNFKVIHSKIIFDIMEKLIAVFQERDIELLLLVLKTVGFSLRKDDPVALKQIILDIQTKIREIENSGGEGMQTRIRFMMDILVAVRNNNMRKIPSYDPSHIEHLRKIIRTLLKGQGLGEDQLSIDLEDLLKVDQVGRWWIVGSAWEGRKDTSEVIKEAKLKTESPVIGTFSKQMLKLAKQQGMNTEIRRHIFCTLGTSEDFEDAFARLIRMGLNRTQEREIVHVLLHCCLNEKEYNPFYSYLAQKFCAFDRRFMVTIQFSMWDKFKEMDKMDKTSRLKLGHLLSHLLLCKNLSLSIFKAIDFGMESKKTIRFLSQVLSNILQNPNEQTMVEIFERIAPFPKLKTLRQGLQVFMRIHLKDQKRGDMASLLLGRIEKAESAMFSHQSSHVLL